MTDGLCPMCGRELGDVSVDEHHLVPKTFKGRVKEKVHKICHQKIHSTFTERELLNHYHTWERIKEHTEMAKFIKWVSNKDPSFYSHNNDTSERRGKRKR